MVAIYHFARTADDIADEGHATPQQRLAELGAYREELRRCLEGQAPRSPWAPVFQALNKQALAFQLPPRWLFALLDAFEQDVRNPEYPDRASLLDYCARSANPIGRLLLHLYEVDDAKSLQRSDAICTALQLINFWQDLSVDGPSGRLYVPLADLQAHGLSPAQVRNCVDSPQSQALVQSLCAWADSLMRSGAPLALSLPGRAGWELRLVVQGGLRILEKIKHMDHRSYKQRPRLGKADALALLVRALTMEAAPL